MVTADAIDFDAWRPALIAFLQVESPWMHRTLTNLSNPDMPLTIAQKWTVVALVEAFKNAPPILVAAPPIPQGKAA